MKTMTWRTTIAADGAIDLHIPTDFPPGPAEVIIIVQPSVPAPVPSAASLSGRFPVAATTADDVVDTIRQLRRETTEASWQLPE